MISRKIARQLGGDVYLKESKPNEGSTFVFCIQVTVPQIEDSFEEQDSSSQKSDSPEKERPSSESDKHANSTLSEHEGPIETNTHRDLNQSLSS